MNRRDARRAAETVASGYRCPDCAAETELTEPASGLYVLEVRHDDTCPAYTAMTHKETR